jgi:hypothetical protein
VTPVFYTGFVGFRIEGQPQAVRTALGGIAIHGVRAGEVSVHQLKLDAQDKE